jgi:hypothetical protein
MGRMFYVVKTLHKAQPAEEEREKDKSGEASAKVGNRGAESEPSPKTEKEVV